MGTIPRRMGTFALVALAALGLSVQVAAATDPQPDCAGQAQGIRYAWVSTEPDGEFERSEIEAGAVLCGSDTQTERGYLATRIRTPDLNAAGKGMAFRCANPRWDTACTWQTDIAAQRFAGSAEVDVMACTALGCLAWDNLRIYIYVDNHPNPNVPDNDQCWATYEGKPVVACLQGADSTLGVMVVGNMLVTKETSDADPTGVYHLHVFQPRSFVSGVTPYYTKLGSRGIYDPARGEMVQDPTDSQKPLRLCKYAGAVGGLTCGTEPADWLQRNGARQLYGCAVGPPGQLPATAPWRLSAERTPGWTPPWASTCIPERWTQ